MLLNIMRDCKNSVLDWQTVWGVTSILLSLLVWAGWIWWIPIGNYIYACNFKISKHRSTVSLCCLSGYCDYSSAFYFSIIALDTYINQFRQAFTEVNLARPNLFLKKSSMTLKDGLPLVLIIRYNTSYKKEIISK